MLHFSMPPPARLLAALARLGAPQPHRVLQPVTNLRHLRTLQAPACQCAAAARVFQDELPAATPSGSSQEAPALPDRTALLAKVRPVSLPRGFPCIVALVGAHIAASQDWQQLDEAYQGTTLGTVSLLASAGALLCILLPDAGAPHALFAGTQAAAVHSACWLCAAGEQEAPPGRAVRRALPAAQPQRGEVLDRTREGQRERARCAEGWRAGRAGRQRCH